MKFEKIKFEEKAAREIYDTYLKRVRKMVKPLNKADQEDILMEINSHIYEGMQQNHSGLETERLMYLLDGLGKPEKILKPLVADKMFEKASKTLNPIHIFKALILNITNGVFFVFVALLYVSLTWCVITILAKLIFPKYVGFYYKPGEIFVLGGIPENVELYREYDLLGSWYIPTMMGVFLVLYAILTIALRIEMYLKNKDKSQNLQTNNLLV